jgi:hypothetical protein
MRNGARLRVVHPCVIPDCAAPATLGYAAISPDGHTRKTITRPSGERVRSCAAHSFEVTQKISTMLGDAGARIRAVRLR